MKQNKKIKLISLTTLTIIVLIWIGIVTTDFICAKKEKEPIFAIHTSTLWDGGTKTYTGIGYMIIDYNQLSVVDQNGELIKNGRTDTIFKFWILPFEF